MIGEEILIEIESTLDQLIRNGETLSKSDLKELSDTELEGFQKTQESLLHHLIHMDEFLVEKRASLKRPESRSATVTIQEKLLRFEKLKQSYHHRLERTAKTIPIFSKRKVKKVIKHRSL